MKSLIMVALIMCYHSIFSQNIFNALVKDSVSNENLVGVNTYIKKLNIGAASNSDGKIEIKNIPDGNYTINFSYIGYKTKKLQFSFPGNKPGKINIISLAPSELALNQIVVTSTRTQNRIENTPIRVEVLGLDEVNEELGIKPGNISKLLGETSGVLLQQTSVSSGNVAFRIQGLPSKYTQLLVDGFPIYSGFSSGLSLLQIPPLNLQQVEVVKGSSSTLYGGDAIAGIVNLITKVPSYENELSFLINRTHKGESDFSGYYSGRNDILGLTFLADYNFQKPVDVNHNGFTDIPKFEQASLIPKLFYYIDKNQTLSEELSFSYDHRKGGDIFAVKNHPDSVHNYLLENKSIRLTSVFNYVNNFSNGNVLEIKNSLNSFYRKINSATNIFAGNQYSSYSELSYLMKFNSHKLVVGTNFTSDNFTEQNNHEVNLSYNQFAFGLFALDDWDISKQFTLQLGLRTDYQRKYKIFVLPQSFLMFKPSENLSLRTGIGWGYKIPSLFTDEAENKIFQNVMPLSNGLKAEKSFSASFDINYKTILFNTITLNFDQSFFLTNVYNNVVMSVDSTSNYGHVFFNYINSPAKLNAKGFDTNFHLSLEDFEFYFEYTYTDAENVFQNHNTFLQLTPKHKINITLTLEDEENWRTGFEAFYTGHELLNNGLKSPDYWIIGLMFQKYFNHFSLIANVENLFDVRQSKFEKIVLPPLNNPTFQKLYAPIDGMVANLALKIDF